VTKIITILWEAARASRLSNNDTYRMMNLCGGVFVSNDALKTHSTGPLLRL